MVILLWSFIVEETRVCSGMCWFWGTQNIAMGDGRTQFLSCFADSGKFWGGARLLSAIPGVLGISVFLFYSSVSYSVTFVNWHVICSFGKYLVQRSSMKFNWNENYLLKNSQYVISQFITCLLFSTGMPKEKYDPPDPRRMYTIMSSEEAANGKKSHWAELEISGKELRHGAELRTHCR